MISKLSINQFISEHSNDYQLKLFRPIYLHINLFTNRFQSLLITIYIYIYIYTKKAKSRRYPTQSITDTDYADEIARVAYTPTQTESQLPSLEQAADGIGLCVNADKMEYVFY